MQSGYRHRLHKPQVKLCAQPFRLLGQLSKKSQGWLNVCQGLRIGSAANRLFPGKHQILDRLSNVAALPIVMGELCDVVVNAVCVQRLHRRAGSLMHQLAALLKDRVVRDVLS